MPDPEETRERLIAAMTRAVAEGGYSHITVEQVARYANLTPDDFFAHFESPDLCLMAAFDNFFERLIGDIEDACRDEALWHEQVKLALHSVLMFLAEAAKLSRVFMIESLTVGTVGVHRYLASIERLAELLRTGRRHYPAAAEMPPELEELLVAGAAQLIASRLLAEEAYALPALAPDLIALLLTPYLGAPEANRIAAS